MKTMIRREFLGCAFVLAAAAFGFQNKGAGTPAGKGVASQEYQAIKNRLIKGWNTWNSLDVLSHILLPEGFTVTLEIEKDQEKVAGPYIGKASQGSLVVTAGGHAYDGSYTDLSIQWKKMNIRVQSATIGGDLVILVSNDRPQEEAALNVVPRRRNAG